MTAIAKSARVALAVTVVALATAGAASADAFHPDPFQSEGAPADVYRPAGSSWSSLGSNHGLRVHLNIGGCTRGCVI